MCLRFYLINSQKQSWKLDKLQVVQHKKKRLTQVGESNRIKRGKKGRTKDNKVRKEEKDKKERNKIKGTIKAINN